MFDERKPEFDILLARIAHTLKGVVLFSASYFRRHARSRRTSKSSNP